MNIKQIYSTINSIRQNMTEGTQNVVSHSDFVSFGEDVLSSATSKEKFYNALLDKIGRTIFAIREYKADERGILVDSFTFGSVLQKISYELQNAEASVQWNTSGTNYLAWNPKGGIKQKLFAQNLPTFSENDVILDYQLESAFTSESAMGGFINGLYIRMNNALEVSIEAMNNTAVNALVAKVYTQATTASDDDEPINPQRARNLLAEYNTLYPSKAFTSVDSALSDADFMKYCCVEMGMLPTYLKKLTRMYNDKSVERFTDSSNLVIEMNAEFEKKYSVYLQSDTFHNDITSLGNYNVVPYWYSPSVPMNIVSNDGTTTTTINNVLAIFRDKDAVVTTLERKDMASQYDAINRRTYVRLSADRRYIADTSENCVIFYADLPTTS